MIIRLNEGAALDDLKEKELSVLEDILKLDSENLILMASRPGMGKTSLALHTALEYVKKSNKTVYIFSHEMLAEHVYQRLIRTVAEVDYQAMQNGTLSEEQKESVLRASEYLKTLNIVVDDDNKDVTPLKIKEKLEKEQNVGFVIVDYIELVKPESGEQISDVLKELKLLAENKNIPIAVTAQLSRKLEKRKDKRPRLEDCEKMAEYSDTVIFVYRDAYYAMRFENPENRSENAEIIVAKNKYGATKTLNLEWRGEFCKFYETARK